MTEKAPHSRFIQILIENGEGNLVALAEDGTVWRYYPSRTDKRTGEFWYAIWIQLTTRRKDNKQKKEQKEAE